MSTTIPKINELTSFSATKSTKDPPPLLASKKKKYVVLGVFFSGVGLAGLSAAAQYSSSSGDGSGGIRSSINIDGSLSSVDLRSGVGNVCTCSPASGTWGGKSFNNIGTTSFETCYKYGPTGEECWSNSHFWWLVPRWYECKPQGYTGNDKGWYWINSGAASKTCGSPCQLF